MGSTPEQPLNYYLRCDQLIKIEDTEYFTVMSGTLI